MKVRIGMLALVTCVGLGLSAGFVGSRSSALAGPEITAATTAPVLAVLDEEAGYIGSSKCKMCHKAQFESWEGKSHGKAFESLKPGVKAESKTAHGLDANKDYTTDEGCLKCHTTGYGKEGGYAIPDAADEKAVKKAEKLANVGCENCHGPGKAYEDLHKAINKEKREYTSEEMYKAGMWKISADVCTKCHNDKSPTFKEFDFEKQKAAGGHENFPLEYRKG